MTSLITAVYDKDKDQIFDANFNSPDYSEPVTVTVDPVRGNLMNGGAFNDAGVFGASPSAIAAANTSALQTALNYGGVVTLNGSGSYLINSTLEIPSNTRLILGNNTRLVKPDGTQSNMLRNKNWRSNKIVVTNGISDAATSPVLNGFRLATADCGANAHGLVAGDSVLIRGDTTRRYNGVHDVVSVTTYTFTFWAATTATAAIGSSSGTITAEQADSNIEVCGGVWDFNGVNNQSAYDITAHAMLFAKTKNLHVHDLQVIGATKYCVYIINSEGARVRNVDVQSASDGIHLHGFMYNALVENISGEAGDDFVAWTASNAGYTQYDYLNLDGSDTISTGGEAHGLTFRNIKPRRCGQDVLVLYPCAGSTYGLEGVLAENIGSYDSTVNHIFSVNLSVVAAPACNSVKDITLRNVYGAGKTSQISFGRSTHTNQITIDRVDISGLYPNATYNVGTGNAFIELQGAVINTMIVEPRANILYDITTANYLITLSGTAATPGASTITDLTINDYHCSTTGAGASHAVIGGGVGCTLTKSRINRPKLFGTSQLVSGTISNTPDIYINDWYVNTYRLAWVNFACRLHVTDGKAINCSNPPIAFYGSGFTAEIMARGNDWGATGQWLQIGTAAGDTLRVDLWASGNYANSGTSTSINWVATSGTAYLRGGDHTLFTDVSKFTAAVAGVCVNNNAAATKPGTGLVTYDGAAWRRVAQKIQAVGSSATPALDCTLGTHVTFTATAASAWGAPTNVPAAGEGITMTLLQDGTGGWAITWNAAYIFPTAWSNTGNTANKKSTIRFVSDGTALVAQGANSWY